MAKITGKYEVLYIIDPAQADTLNLAENTVSKRLNRGRTALYDILAKEGYHAEDFQF